MDDHHRMKDRADDENEVHDLGRHQDSGVNRLTAVVTLAPAAALAVVDALAAVVRSAHADEVETPTPPDELQRAQIFEEGHVYLLAPPFEGYFADRYLMDFYDVRDREFCSRMHLHTGLRFVRMMTGPDTRIRVSSLSPIAVAASPGWRGGKLVAFVDVEPSDEAGQEKRYNVVVPPNSWVDMQIPRGVSHQFNADGPNAIIDSVHPEESIETLREGMSGYRMMAQTIFLAEEHSSGETCQLNEPL